MTIEEVKEHFKDAKVVKCLMDSRKWIIDLSSIRVYPKEIWCHSEGSGAGVKIWDESKGFAEIIEYKDKPTQITVGNKNSTVSDWLKSTFTVDVPKGMEIDKDSIKFKKIEKQLPNSWEEYFVNVDSIIFQRAWLYTPKEYLALRKLELLRDCYNDGWKADWKNDDGNYSLRFHGNEILTPWCDDYNLFLNFKTAELRDKFLENFKDIIEIAKPLL